MSNTAVSGQWLLLDTGMDSNDRSFRNILLPVLVVFFTVSIVIPLINVPGPQQTAGRQHEPRTARLLEKKVLPRPAAPEKPAQKKTAAAQPEKPLTRQEKIKKAREKALRSGLLAFRKEISDLKTNKVLENIRKQKSLTAGEDTRAGVPDSELLDSSVTEASQGLDAQVLQHEIGPLTLAERELTQIDDSSVASEEQLGIRSREEIRIVLDVNKGGLNALYNRALRKNPVLAGKLVLKLTIAADGRVTACELVSSELAAPELERKLVKRVLLFEFPAREVDEISVIYPIEFYPR